MALIEFKKMNKTNSENEQYDLNYRVGNIGRYIKGKYKLEIFFPAKFNKTLENRASLVVYSIQNWDLQYYKKIIEEPAKSKKLEYKIKSFSKTNLH